MNVKQLIAYLEDIDPELSVYIRARNTDYDTIPKNLERARMAGMIDAFNYIIEGIKRGEYME